MLKHYVPANFYDRLKENPKLTGLQLYEEGLASSPRSARRWKMYVEQDRAVRDAFRVHSVQMLRWEEEKEDNELSLEEIIRLSRQQVASKQAHDPIFITDDLYFEDNVPISVIFVSCAHLGGRFTAYEEFERIFNQALGIPNLYWASLGDDIEGFLPQFPDNKSVIEQVWQIDTQVELIQKVLTTLREAGKLLFGMGSQHGGKWLNKYHGDNPIKKAYLDLGVPFYDGIAYLKLHVGDQIYNVATAHDFPGDSIWNPLHRQTRAFYMNFPNAHLVVGGDRHKFAWAEIPASEWEAVVGNRSSNRVLLLQVGTAKTVPDIYTIQHWSTGLLGWPIVTFYPEKNKLNWTWDINDIKGA